MTIINTQTIATFDQNSVLSGWLPYNKILETIRKAINLEDFNPELVFHDFADSTNKNPNNYWWSLSFPGSDVLRLHGSLGASQSEAANQAKAFTSDISISPSGLELSDWNLISFPNPPDLDSTNAIADSDLYTDNLVYGEISGNRLYLNLKNTGTTLGVGGTALSIDLESPEATATNPVDSGTAVNVNAQAMNDLGIVTNRPAFICDSNYVPLGDPFDGVITAEEEAISRALMFRLAKNEHVQNYFQKFQVDNPDLFTDLTNDYNTQLIKANQTIKFLEGVDEYKQNFLSSINDYLNYGLDIFGYTPNAGSTSAIAQSIFDLGKMPFQMGSWSQRCSNFKTSDKNFEKNVFGTTQGASGRNSNSTWLWRPRSNTKEGALANFSEYISSDMKNFSYTNTTDTSASAGSGLSSLQSMRSKFSDLKSKIKSSSANQNNWYDWTVPLLQTVWNEYMTSYLISQSNDDDFLRNVELIKSEQNIFAGLLNGIQNTGGLLSAANDKGLPKVLRYPLGSSTIMPFENTGLAYESTDSSLSSTRTAIDSWIEPNIGNIMEGLPTDFSGLDEWSAEFDSLLDTIKNSIEAYVGKGSGIMIVNAIALAIRDCITTSPSTEHPHGLYTDNPSYDEEEHSFSPFWFQTPEDETSEEGSGSTRSFRTLAFVLEIFDKACKDMEICFMIANLTCNWHTNIDQIWSIIEQLFDPGDKTKEDFQEFTMAEGWKDWLTESTARYPENDVVKTTMAMITSIVNKVEKNLLFSVASVAKDLGLTNKAVTPEDWPEIFNNIFEGKSVEVLPAGVVYSSIENPSVVITQDSAINGDWEADQIQAFSRCSDSPHMFLRGIIVYCIGSIANELSWFGNEHGFKTVSMAPDISWIIGNNLTDSPKIYQCLRKIGAELHLIAVDNNDSSEIPYSWGQSSGQWPGDSETLLGESAYLKYIPDAVRLWLGEVTSDDVGDWNDGIFDEWGYGQIWTQGGYHHEDFEKYFSFLEEKDNYVPITFRTESERPANDQKNYVIPNRGEYFTDVLKAYHIFLEGHIRLIEYLDGIKLSFSEIQPTIEAMAESQYSEAVMEVAQFPGIEIPELTRYATPRQHVLRKLTLENEKPLNSIGFVPRSNFISSSDVKIASNILRQHAEDNSEVSEGGKVSEGHLHVVGIPYGMLDTPDVGSASTQKTIENRLMVLKHYCHPLMLNSYSQPIKHVFDPLLFIPNGVYADLNLDAYSTTIAVMKAIKYYYVEPTGTSASLIGYDYLVELLQTKIDQAKGTVDPYQSGAMSDTAWSDAVLTPDKIIYNHLVDHAIKFYFQYYNGLNFSESAFALNSDALKHMLNPLANDNRDDIFNHTGIEDLSIILDDDGFMKSLEEYKNSVPGDQASQVQSYTNFYSLCQSRYLSSNAMISNVIVPKIFDRTFAIYTHLGTLRFNENQYSNIPAVNQSSLILDTTNTSDSQIYKIDMHEAVSGNLLVNDNITFNFFQIETI